MSATVHVSASAAITLDVITQNINGPQGVLFSIQGKHHGETLNCVLIPVGQVDAVIEALRLAAHQIKPLAPR